MVSCSTHVLTIGYVVYIQRIYCIRIAFSGQKRKNIQLRIRLKQVQVDLCWGMAFQERQSRPMRELTCAIGEAASLHPLGLGASSSVWVHPGHTRLLHRWACIAGQAEGSGKGQQPRVRPFHEGGVLCCFAQQVVPSHLHLRDFLLHLIGQSDVTGLPYVHDSLRNHIVLAEQTAIATPAPSQMRASAMREERGWLLSGNQQHQTPDWLHSNVQVTL